MNRRDFFEAAAAALVASTLAKLPQYSDCAADRCLLEVSDAPRLKSDPRIRWAFDVLTCRHIGCLFDIRGEPSAAFVVVSEKEHFLDPQAFVKAEEYLIESAEQGLTAGYRGFKDIFPSIR